MQILLSCAKDMASKPITYPNERANEPRFIAEAKEIATEMMNFSPGFFLMGESFGSASRYRFVLIPFGCT